MDRGSVVIVGAGVFGLTGALELRRRGHEVTVVDPGPVPHPMAASNDISRMVRMDYGNDRLYSLLAAEAIEGWHRWNIEWGRDYYHEDGFLLLTSQPMADGGFEADSFTMLTGDRWPLRLLGEAEIAEGFPGWGERYINGYLNPRAGWAEAGATIAALARVAETADVRIVSGFRAASIIEEEGRAAGVRSSDGAEIRAGEIVVAAGVWTPTLLPKLSNVMWTAGQPIFYFAPPDPERYRPPQFPPWGADIPRSGWYGFPANGDGIVKIANHGPGHRVPPDTVREVQPGDEDRLRRFLRESFPELADAPLSGSKMCVYCDTWDGDFWIGRDPDLPGLTVATGGSGHAFKFAPVLGWLVADAVEGKDNSYSQRFAWRERGETKTEDARYSGE